MRILFNIIFALLIVAGVFLIFNSQINTAPAKNSNGVDLIANISINNVVNNSLGSSAQYLVNYTVNYKNIGNVASMPVTGLFAYSMLCNSTGGGGSGANVPVPALNPNQATNLYLSSTVNCHGLWRGIAVVDIFNNQTEIREDNNNASVVRTI